MLNIIKNPQHLVPSSFALNKTLPSSNPSRAAPLSLSINKPYFFYLHSLFACLSQSTPFPLQKTQKFLQAILPFPSTTLINPIRLTKLVNLVPKPTRRRLRRSRIPMTSEVRIRGSKTLSHSPFLPPTKPSACNHTPSRKSRAASTLPSSTAPTARLLLTSSWCRALLRCILFYSLFLLSNSTQHNTISC